MLPSPVIVEFPAPSVFSQNILTLFTTLFIIHIYKHILNSVYFARTALIGQCKSCSQSQVLEAVVSRIFLVLISKLR